jgi:hypothetical protein
MAGKPVGKSEEVSISKQGKEMLLANRCFQEDASEDNRRIAALEPPGGPQREDRQIME